MYDGRGVPIAQNSVFGYVVGGHFDTSHALDGRTVLGLAITMNLDQKQHKKKQQLISDELRDAEQFLCTLSRNETGRYIVRLPFDGTTLELDESATAAIRRFEVMEREFSVEQELKHYLQFMAEYAALVHMAKIPPCEVAVVPEKSFYLLHHAGWKVDSKMTKLRVVYDASSKSATGESPNDRLLEELNVYEPLFNVFSHWRTYKIASCADIEKKCRQVPVTREDADFQRVMWPENPNQPLEHYRLLIVIYQRTSASYQAVAILQQVVDDNEQAYPQTAARIPKKIHVNDLLSDSIDESKFFRNAITEVLAGGGFVHRKWSSNVPQLLECSAA